MSTGATEPRTPRAASPTPHGSCCCLLRFEFTGLLGEPFGGADTVRPVPLPLLFFVHGGLVKLPVLLPEPRHRKDVASPEAVGLRPSDQPFGFVRFPTVDAKHPVLFVRPT